VETAIVLAAGQKIPVSRSLFSDNPGVEAFCPSIEMPPVNAAAPVTSMPVAVVASFTALS
jgi:hypothetical protein